jgi:prephenate dehydrogenase
MTTLGRKVVILGTGLIGGSLAAAGRAAGLFDHVVGVGRSRENLEAALAAGIIDELSQRPADALEGADLVIVAAPADACTMLLGVAAEHTDANCVLTDVASVKVPVCEEAVRLDVADRFVGAHPMAGSTRSGAAAADASLFAGRTTVLTPLLTTAESARSLVRRMWEAVGAHTLELDADVHDALVARASHLPQMVAFCLSALAERSSDRDRLRALVASGFIDTTRLAGSDPAMWRAIARLNCEYIVAAMDELSELWTELRAAIAGADESALDRIMKDARSFRRDIES